MVAVRGAAAQRGPNAFAAPFPPPQTVSPLSATRLAQLSVQVQVCIYSARHKTAFPPGAQTPPPVSYTLTKKLML